MPIGGGLIIRMEKTATRVTPGTLLSARMVIHAHKTVVSFMFHFLRVMSVYFRLGLTDCMSFHNGIQHLKVQTTKKPTE